MHSPVTVYVKKKKQKRTKFDLERLHDRWLEDIDRRGKLIKICAWEPFRTFCEVIYTSSELLTGQLRELREKTGYYWSRGRYYRTMKELKKRLKD